MQRPPQSRLRVISLVAVVLVLGATLTLLGCNTAAPATDSSAPGTKLPSSAITGTSVPVALDTGEAAVPGLPSSASSPVIDAGSTAISLQTQEAPRNDMRATSIALSTASPYPNAEAAQVKTGKPALAAVRRGDLALELRLPKSSYLVGEGGKAQVIISNKGAEKLFGRDISIALLDTSGQVSLWPLMPMMRNGPGRSGEFYELAAGESISRTFFFQVPPMEIGGATAQQYNLWAATRFTRGLQAGGNRGPDFVGLDMEAGPLPLEITQPQPAQRLMAQLKADAKGYSLSAVDSEGKPPSGPLWGMMETTWQHGGMGLLLQDGTWASPWPNSDMVSSGHLTVWAWVASEGYVTAAITQTIFTDGSPVSNSKAGARHQIFASLGEAQAFLGSPLSAPSYLSEGVALDRVEVDSMSYEQGSWWEVRQAYRLAGGASLRLSQMNNIGAFPMGFGPENPEFRDAAQRIMAGRYEVYARQRFGLWMLVWKADDVGFVLSAPIEATSLESLIKIAGSDGPANR